MAQRLRAPAALLEVPSSIPSNHMVAHNHLQCGPMPSSGVSEDSYSVCIYIYIYKIKRNRAQLLKPIYHHMKSCQRTQCGLLWLTSVVFEPT